LRGGAPEAGDFHHRMDDVSKGRRDLEFTANVSEIFPHARRLQGNVADCTACDAAGVSTTKIFNTDAPPTVDGTITPDEWPATSTGFLYNAGQTDPSAGNYELLGRYWLVYNCLTGTMYARAEINPGRTISDASDQSWVKTGSFTWVNGSSTNFRYVYADPLNPTAGTEIGFEASFAYTVNACELQVHVNNDGGQTASSGRFPTSDIFCYELMCTVCSAGGPCDDVEVCTDDSCGDNGFCLNVFDETNDSSCDLCTDVTCGDTCEVCVSGLGYSGCVPDPDCTANPCDDVTCDAAVCLECVNGSCESSCGDCEVCDNGSCALDSDCTDPCVDVTCDAAACLECVNGSCESSCGDCEVCDNGSCVNQCDACHKCEGDQCVANFNCDDSIDCTTDACEDRSGVALCVYTPVNAECEDEIPCTTNACVPDRGGCVVTAYDNALCSDGIGCTNDLCTDTGCESTPSNSNCNDNIGCTDDTCDPQDPAADASTGCVITPQDSKCNDGFTCTVDTCSPNAVGADSSSGCLFSPDNNKCDDTDECTTDTCEPAVDGSDTSSGCTNVEFCCPYGDYAYSYKCGLTQFICAAPDSNVYMNFLLSVFPDNVYDLEECTVGTGQSMVDKKTGETFEAVEPLDYPACASDFLSGVEADGKCGNRRGISNWAAAKCVSTPDTAPDQWQCCGKEDVSGVPNLTLDVAAVCGSTGGGGGGGGGSCTASCTCSGDTATAMVGEDNCAAGAARRLSFL